MACFHPQTAWRSREGRNPATGLWPIVFNVKEGYIDQEITIPCGKCIGCRLERSRQWAVRCMNEAQMHVNNCFITLTYNEKHVIERCGIFDEKEDKVTGLSLNKRDFVLFMKRMRKYYGDGIRFFHCGEYGERFSRPHHHACIFGHDFHDKVLWKVRSGVRLYRSPELEKLWPYGYSTIGEVTFDSAAYVARYIVKKITGEKAEKHYEGRQEEYITMSRKPGIGKEWFEKYKGDVLSQDKIIVKNGLTCRPPRYYDKIYDQLNHARMELIKRRRLKAHSKEDQDYKRLRAKELVTKLKLKSKIRPVEGWSYES